MDAGVEREHADRGSIFMTMSKITDASFWKDVATSRRGWKRSTASARTSSAVSGSRSSVRDSTAVMRLDRALALAADDLEGDVAVPVDEAVHRLEAELDRQREVADLRPRTRLVPTRAAKALNSSPSSRSASYKRSQRSTASGTRLAGRRTFRRVP